MSAIGSALLYLLSVNAVACALLAWTDAGLGAMVGWAAAIGVAHAVGERLGVPFAAIDTRRRDRMGVFLGTLQVSVLVIALVLAAASPTPGLLGFLVSVFAGYQLLVTVLLRLTTEPRGLVGQALALTALSCLRGGPLGAWAAASSLALAGVYVALDHHGRLLAAHRVDDAPHARGALVRGAAVVLPVALAVGLVAYRVAPLPRPDPPPETIVDAYKPVDEKPKRELDLRALRALVLSGLGGAVFIYFVGRWLVRSKKGERGAIETPEPLRGALERIREPPSAAAARPSYAGRRGRVVRAYLDLLRGADRAGFARRPDETAGEFAAALGEPRTPLETATGVFVRARYGPFEVTDEDVQRAEHGGAAVLEHLARHPPDAAGPGRPRRRFRAGGRFSRTPSFVISILLIVPSGSSYPAVTRRSNQLGPARGASRPPRFASGLASGRRARLPGNSRSKAPQTKRRGTCSRASATS